MSFKHNDQLGVTFFDSFGLSDPSDPIDQI